MKPIFIFAFLLLCIKGIGQAIPSQIQAKRGVFTERLFLKDRWIDRISTDANADSTSDNALVTGNAVKLATGNSIKNQATAAQQASFSMQGQAVIGSHNNFKSTLSSGYPANAYVTQGSGQYGLSIQRSTDDINPASLVLFKNNAADFNSLNALQFGDPIGSINFSGIAGDNSTVSTPMRLYGFVEKTAPTYLSSGFIFSTTDTNGVHARRMGINAQGNLMIGNATTNPYKLNVVDGDVRFETLAYYGDLMAGINNDGMVTKVFPDWGLYVSDETLHTDPPSPGSSGNYSTYIAVLTQTGTNDPVVTVLENSIGEELVWTRNSAGQYTATSEFGFYWGSTILQSHASDPSGNLLFTRFYRNDQNTLILVVKDSAMVNKDGWSQITVEIRKYITG